jgi:hypothetical protein
MRFFRPAFFFLREKETPKFSPQVQKKIANFSRATWKNVSRETLIGC